MDVARINGFFERYGLTGKPFVGVDEAGQQLIKEVMGFGRGPTKTVASHFPLVGVTYVLRGSRETTKGSNAIEADVVHEVSHANQSIRDILIYKLTSGKGIEYVLLRSGFVVYAGKHKSGVYPEEGFGGLVEHIYN